MKKLLLMAFLAFGMTAHAETVVNVDDEDTPAKSGVDLGKGKDEDDRWSAHVYVGVNVPTDVPDGMKFAPFRSWELNLTLFQYDYTPKNTKTTLSAGLGFGWRAYTLRGHDKMFEKDLADNIWVFPALSTYKDLSSNVHTTSLSMPLFIKQRFSKDFAISLGGQLNWNYYARLHTSYEIGDKDYDEYTKNIDQRPFTVDVMGIVHVWSLGFYCKYSPMSVFKSDCGPEFKSLAFGLYF
jgi:hypothetical protein